MNASQAPGLNPGPAVVAPGPGVVSSAGASVTLNAQVNPVDDDRSSLFVMSHGLTTPEADELLRKWGRNELVGKTTPMWWIIFRQVMFENSLYRVFRPNIRPIV
jgi:hypothetical protein